MTDHLPECPVPTLRSQTIAKYVCCCRLLRACEERVAKDYRNREMNGLAWLDGYDHGLLAARDAVETAWTEDPSWDGTNWNNALHEALTAIDSLREKQK